MPTTRPPLVSPRAHGCKAYVSLCAILIGLFGFAAWSSPARAAYVCELYGVPPNEPGGDRPAEVYFTNKRDAGLAERACEVLRSRGNWLASYVRPLAEELFPSNWRVSDLLVRAGFVPPTPRPSPSPSPTPVSPRVPGYACVLYSGSKVVATLYTDTLDVSRVTAACRARMHRDVSAYDRDFAVVWYPVLPPDWLSALFNF